MRDWGKCGGDFFPKKWKTEMAVARIPHKGCILRLVSPNMHARLTEKKITTHSKRFPLLGLF